MLRTVLDCNTCCSVEISTLFDNQVVKIVAKRLLRLQVQMNEKRIDPLEPKSITGFLHAIKRACDNNGIQEGATMCLFPYFMKRSEASALMARLSLK